MNPKNTIIRIDQVTPAGRQRLPEQATEQNPASTSERTSRATVAGIVAWGAIGMFFIVNGSGPVLEYLRGDDAHGQSTKVTAPSHAPEQPEAKTRSDAGIRDNQTLSL